MSVEQKENQIGCNLWSWSPDQQVDKMLFAINKFLSSILN